jgi:hypothetical protein
LEDRNKINEEIFYGWREEVPLGKTKGEVKQVFYHWKIEEKENSQIKTSPIKDKKDYESKEEVNKQNQSQKPDNKDNNKNIYYGVGLISLILLATGLVVVRIKKKK